MNLDEHTVEWLSGFINHSHATSRGPGIEHVRTLVKHGLADTRVIADYWNQREIIATLPDAMQIGADDLDEFLLIGGPAWIGDPDSREEWLTVGRLAHLREEGRKHHTRNGTAYKGRSNYSVAADEVVTWFYEAGRGPNYARQIINIARDYPDAEIDAFGFGDDITPAIYRDLLDAGVRSRDDVALYTRHGLTLTEAIQYRADGIPAAAIGMAVREGYVKGQWHDVLEGLPIEWFRDYGGVRWGDEGALDAYFLRTSGNDRYDLADLRYLVDRGWTGEDSLEPRGITFLTPDLYAQTARTLADHGLTWGAMDTWAKALAQGKRPREEDRRWSNTTAPLLNGRSHMRGYGTNAIGAHDLDRIFPIVDRGIRASHLATYRRMGCTSPEDVVKAFDLGIDVKAAERLVEEHGESRGSGKGATKLIRSLSIALTAWDRERRDTPETSPTS